MKNLKRLFRIFLYLSFGFIVYYLYSFDYIIFSEISINPFILGTSLVLLWAGFVASALSWKKSLNIHQIKISNNLGIFSHGISIFAKYIPGKVWVIIGRASVVSERKGSLAELGTISMKEQLVYLLAGLIVSFIALLWLPMNPIYYIIVALTALFLSLLLFSKRIHHLVLSFIKTITKKELKIPFVSLNKALPMFKVITAYWFLWSFGFYILVLSVLPDAPLIVTFAFPLSVCYGLLAIIVPGGIGVRESIIVFFLTKSGIEPSFAVTISLIQRLWFITGEMFIFGFALILRNKIQKREN